MAELCDYPTEELVEELNKRGIEVQPLIEHHEKYLEIDGEDKTIWVTHKEHREIHREWRKKGRKIPLNVCRAAASRAHGKRDYAKHKPERKAHQKVYRQKHVERNRLYMKEYSKKYIYKFSSSEAVFLNIVLREELRINKKTGIIGYASRFTARNGQKLPIIDI